MAAPEQTSGENHLRFDEPKFDSEGGAADRKQSGTDQKGSIYAKPDLENGEEYANLVSYIATYYEGPRRKSVVSMEEQQAGKKKKPWWKLWQGKAKTAGGEDGFEIPDDVRDSFSCNWSFNAVTDVPYSGSRRTSSRVSRARKSRIVASTPASTSS